RRRRSSCMTEASVYAVQRVVRAVLGMRAEDSHRLGGSLCRRGTMTEAVHHEDLARPVHIEESPRIAAYGFTRLGNAHGSCAEVVLRRWSRPGPDARAYGSPCSPRIDVEGRR